LKQVQFLSVDGDNTSGIPLAAWSSSRNSERVKAKRDNLLRRINALRAGGRA
jgi:hypothetical protein